MKGIGLRAQHQKELSLKKNPDIDFLELSPENWMLIGGYKRECLDKIVDLYTIYAHGISLSIGGYQNIDVDYLKKIKLFLDNYNIENYSEHLSFSADDNGCLYDLLPLPRLKDQIEHVIERIEIIQDILKRPLILENISYYHQYDDNQMIESDFIDQILNRTGSKILLDINNLYVNSVNHSYDPLAFIHSISKNNIAYYHIAGHLETEEGFLIDTHGTNVSSDVLNLARYCFQNLGKHPLLLERDNFIPSLDKLSSELSNIYEFVRS